MPRMDIKETIFRLEDGSGEKLTVKVGEGTISYTEKKTREFLLDRGTLDAVRNGDQEPLEVSWQLAWEFITGAPDATVPTIEDALKQRGVAADWTSSNPDACQPYSVDLVALYTPVCNSEVKEKWTFPMFYYENLDHDFKAGTIACQGRCNALEPTVERGNQYT